MYRHLLRRPRASRAAKTKNNHELKFAPPQPQSTMAELLERLAPAGPMNCCPATEIFFLF
jgi:hypothetical protein